MPRDFSWVVIFLAFALAALVVLVVHFLVWVLRWYASV